jgi:hypothetical protein
MNLGFDYMDDWREVGKARDLFVEGLQIARSMADQRRIALLGGLLGLCLGCLGDRTTARARLAEALEVAEDSLSPIVLVFSLESVAHFACMVGEPLRALRYFGAEGSALIALKWAQSPPEERFLALGVDAARAALREETGSDEAADRAMAEGRGVTLEASIADASAWLRDLDLH